MPRKSGKLMLLAMVLLSLVMSLNGCGGSSLGTPQQGKNEVSIKGFQYDPAAITINKGETVTWTNNDTAAHTVTGKGFDSGRMENKAVFKFTFNETGSFDYICTYHPNMKGQVTVK